MRFPAFVGPTYSLPATSADVERCINLIPERMESQGAKAPVVYVDAPGLRTFAVATAAPGRGCFAQNGRAFAVLGSSFIEIEDDGTKIVHGVVASTNQPATISSSGDGGSQLFITSGGKGYCFDLSTDTLTEELASGADVGAFSNGYFLCLNLSDSSLRFSDLFDGTTWDPAQVALRTAESDRWQGMLVVGEEVWLYGEQTTEVWRDYGVDSPAYPIVFSLVPGAVIQTGIQATYSACDLGGTSIWLAQTAMGASQVVMGNNYSTPTRVSTHAVEYAISGYATTNDAIGFTYADAGHTFYVLTFPTQGHTWVYDLSTGLWHERLFWNTATGMFEAYRAAFHMYAFGKHLVLDRASGTFYELRSDVYTDAGGEALRRVRVSPHLSEENVRMFYRSFELLMDVGVGISGTEPTVGVDPQVMLRISKDGGYTWGNELWTSAGKLGEYGTRVMWHRLGAARRAVFEVSMTDPVPFRITDAYLDVQAGAH
jgi:hypothetical protein